MCTLKLPCYIVCLITTEEMCWCGVEMGRFLLRNLLYPAEEQVSPYSFLHLGCQFLAVKTSSSASSLSSKQKKHCHFKFSGGNWHFIIYVFHVIMLDNITNDAIRSTGNIKWCTPVLTWEQSNSSSTASPAKRLRHTQPLHGALLPDRQAGWGAENQFH